MGVFLRPCEHGSRHGERLPNGNTMIVDVDLLRILEVTSANEAWRGPAIVLWRDPTPFWTLPRRAGSPRQGGIGPTKWSFCRQAFVRTLIDNSFRGPYND